MFLSVCSPRSSARRDADAARFCNGFEPGRDIDAIAENVIPLDQDVAKMDAHAPFHSALAGEIRVALHCELLQREGTFDGPNHRGELDQHAVTSCLDDAPAMLGNEWIGGDR